MSDIIRNLKRVERSLSNVSSNAGSIAKDYPDAKSKLYSLENDIEKLVSEVRKIRKKIESGNMD
jgi:hypothetical protein